VRSTWIYVPPVDQKKKGDKKEEKSGVGRGKKKEQGGSDAVM